ncbi:MAG: bifunctional tetrahydrofolate synthase/dihydrofolate synthase [Chromatiales bacterium]|nr:bifunctional tetrahydrofolate synthase/dihydrofolate synthase [Chromatiales bacterium]
MTVHFQSLSEWLTWQGDVHRGVVRLGLERVREVASRLDLLRPGVPVITVGGTNGKGSVVAMLESILLAAGHRVGAFTSPHILDYTERVRIDGRPVAEAALCEVFDAIESARGEVALTIFEYAALAALWLFRRAKVDVVVLEVGLGGRLDAVNVIDADVAVVASIGIDHVQYLGPDRESIGREKAGIFRRGRRAICGDRDPPQSLFEAARETGADLVCIGRDFDARPHAALWDWRGSHGGLEHLPRPALQGVHQYGNAACVLEALDALSSILPVSREAIERGLRSVSLAGRFQHLRESPAVYVDVAHNPHAARSLADQLRAEPCGGRTLAVFGALEDKDAAGMVDALDGLVDAWYLGAIEQAGDGGRSGPLAPLLARVAGRLAGRYRSFPTLADACRAALADALPQDRIVAFGSFLTVAAATRFFMPARSGGDAPV